MIIIGYPCIGKSALAKVNSAVIDLESSYFKIDGRDNSGWEENYCNLAKELSAQGYMVFVSSHKEVVDFLTHSAFCKDVFVCYPSKALHPVWKDRAFTRYHSSNRDKDKRAYERIRDFFEMDVDALANNPNIENSQRIVLYDNDYDLEIEINNHIWRILG